MQKKKIHRLVQHQSASSDSVSLFLGAHHSISSTALRSLLASGEYHANKLFRCDPHIHLDLCDNSPSDLGALVELAIVRGFHRGCHGYGTAGRRGIPAHRLFNPGRALGRFGADRLARRQGVRRRDIEGQNRPRYRLCHDMACRLLGLQELFCLEAEYAADDWVVSGHGVFSLLDGGPKIIALASWRCPVVVWTPSPRCDEIADRRSGRASFSYHTYKRI